jgi:hypothetical protein
MNSIAEIRSSLDAGNKKKGLPSLPDSFPDWAVRHIYERRNGLELTPVPAEVIREAEQRSAKRRAERAKAAIADSGTDAKEEADRELARLRLAVSRLQ